jgi:hypothetical protein
MRGLAARLSVAIVAVGLAGALVSGSPARAYGADPCPEPNDQFQQACLLVPDRPAVGFISQAGDVDAYRLTALDFQAQLHLELADASSSYQIELADWNGRVVQTSANGILDATLGPPGVYYAFVWSPDGTASDDQPYQLSAQVRYPGGASPRVVVSRDWGAALMDRTRETPLADYIWTGGRFTINMKRARGIAPAPNGMEISDLRDFTWTFDARLTNGADGAGFGVQFRHVADTQPPTALLLLVGVDTGRVELTKMVNGVATRLGEVSASAVDTAGGVNRTTIRAIGSDVLVNINGQDVIQAQDSDVRAGSLRFAARANGQVPPAFNFDNILATTPGEG